jgi:hypothetical protein
VHALQLTLSFILGPHSSQSSSLPYVSVYNRYVSLRNGKFKFSKKSYLPEGSDALDEACAAGYLEVFRELYEKKDLREYVSANIGELFLAAARKYNPE